MTATRKATRARTVAERAEDIALDLEVQRAVADAGLPDDAAFAGWVRAALAGRRSAAELAIRLVAADEGRALNRTWRGRDAPTNVLSFTAELPPGVDLPLLGDLVICAPVVAAEAAAEGKTLNDHYAHLTVHGVLHLLGLDHEEDAAAQVMEAEERRILAELGIADPYRDAV